MSDETRQTYDDVRGDNALGDDRRTVTTTTGRRWGGGSRETEIGENVMQVRDRVQWGPIIAGVLTAIATLLILTVLGLAIGSTAIEPREAGQGAGTAAAIWGGLSAIIAFFLGGWVAAKTAAVGGPGSGMINGLMVGVTILTLVLYLTGSGVAAIIGTLGSNIGDIANVAQDQAQADPQQAQQAEQQTQQAQQQLEQVDPNQAFNTVRDSAWGTFLGLILPLIAAALGGLLGHNKRRDLIEGTR
ncbi:MAG: hypothetical protein H0W06_02150 [Chloroflexia bacterium]|nr:hypothetical protein [Chloroflexia bacterium]